MPKKLPRLPEGFPSHFESSVRVQSIAKSALITYRALEAVNFDQTVFEKAMFESDPTFVNTTAAGKEAGNCKYRIAQFFVVLAWDAFVGIFENHSFIAAWLSCNPSPNASHLSKSDLVARLEVLGLGKSDICVAKSIAELRNAITHGLGYWDVARRSLDGVTRETTYTYKDVTVEALLDLGLPSKFIESLGPDRKTEKRVWTMTEDWHSSNSNRVGIKLEFGELTKVLGSVLLLAYLVLERLDERVLAAAVPLRVMKKGSKRGS